MGPTDPIRDDGFRAARAVSIEARARLLRLSRHDATLVRVYTADLLQSLADGLFGRRQAAGQDASEAIVQLLSRRAPALVVGFNQAFRGEVNAGASEAELVRRVDDLATIRERVLNEFGRTAGRRASHPG
jgi:hypothetical protein